MSQFSYGTFESLVLGIKLRDAVILAGTKRVSYGYLVMSQAGKTVYLINGQGVAFAGHIADIQDLVRQLRVEVGLLETTLGRKVNATALANRLGVFLYSWKVFPHAAFAIVGGFDYYPKLIPKLYSLDPVGSVLEEDYTATGFSADIAIGVLEDGYSKDLSIEEGRNLIIAALKSVSQRDALAGKIIDLAVIKKDKATTEVVKI